MNIPHYCQNTIVKDSVSTRAGPINDIISNRNKIYVDNDDKLWTFLLDMD